MINKINYTDVGARGNLTDPWFYHENELNVFGFEADPIECKRLQEKYPNRKYFNFALSSKKGMLNIYLTKNLAQSSIYPPNEKNIQFEKQHWDTRQTKSKIEVKCSTIDDSLVKNNVDAIKIDTQGSEYEILKGGVNTLISQKPILFLETWCHPVYSGVPLMHEILHLTYPLGYELWAAEPAAAWRYQTQNKYLQMKRSRARLTGLNLMLVPQLEELKKLNSERIRAKIKILRWYKFLDAAYILATHIGDKDLMLKIGSQISRQTSIIPRCFDKLKRIIFRYKNYPPIT